MNTDIVTEFVIQKAIEEFHKQHDCNVQVITTIKKRFYSDKEENPFHENYDDTTFRISMPNSYQVVDLEFYRLIWDNGIFHSEVGITYETSVPESNFHSVAYMVSMTPVFIAALKKSLKHWGETMAQEANSIMDAMPFDNPETNLNHLNKVRAQVKERREKIAARDPKLAPYYDADPRLDCKEFLVTRVFTEK